MRKLTTIPGFMIIFFFISSMTHYTDNLSRYLIAVGTLLVVVCFIVIKIPRPGQKEKKKGYILRG